jgi:hypothetical protein
MEALNSTFQDFCDSYSSVDCFTHGAENDGLVFSSSEKAVGVGDECFRFAARGNEQFIFWDLCFSARLADSVIIFLHPGGVYCINKEGRLVPRKFEHDRKARREKRPSDATLHAQNTQIEVLLTTPTQLG